MCCVRVECYITYVMCDSKVLYHNTHIIYTCTYIYIYIYVCVCVCGCWECYIEIELYRMCCVRVECYTICVLCESKVSYHNTHRIYTCTYICICMCMCVWISRVLYRNRVWNRVCCVRVECYIICVSCVTVKCRITTHI